MSKNKDVYKVLDGDDINEAELEEQADEEEPGIGVETIEKKHFEEDEMN